MNACRESFTQFAVGISRISLTGVFLNRVKLKDTGIVVFSAIVDLDTRRADKHNSQSLCQSIRFIEGIV